MSSPLAGLVRAYKQQIAWTRGLRHLGLPTTQRGLPPSVLPAADVSDITIKSKDQRGIGVAYDNWPVSLAAPASWPKMRRIAIELVLNGAHPEDIIVWNYDPETDEITHMRTAIDHLLWTHEDQRRLEKATSHEHP